MEAIATITAFRLSKTARGYSLTFKQDGKTRRIVFDEGTMPYNWTHKYAQQLWLACDTDNNQAVIDYVHWLRLKGYRFYANPRNKSVFYPQKVAV